MLMPLRGGENRSTGCGTLPEQVEFGSPRAPVISPELLKYGWVSVSPARYLSIPVLPQLGHPRLRVWTVWGRNGLTRDKTRKPGKCTVADQNTEFDVLIQGGPR